MKRLVFIFLLTVVAGFVVWPQVPGNYIPGGNALPGNPGIHLGTFVRQGAKLGLDLQGGTQLTLKRPAPFNAMSSDLVDGLYDACDRLQDDRDTRVVVRTGAGWLSRTARSGRSVIDRPPPPHAPPAPPPAPSGLGPTAVGSALAGSCSDVLW